MQKTLQALELRQKAVGMDVAVMVWRLPPLLLLLLALSEFSVGSAVSTGKLPFGVFVTFLSYLKLNRCIGVFFFFLICMFDLLFNSCTQTEIPSIYPDLAIHA